MAVKMFSAGCEEQARALASEVYRRGVSVIVADYLFFPAYLAARVAGVPFVTLYHSALPFPVEGAPPFGSGLLAGSPSDPAWQRASRRFEAIAGWLTKRTAQACRSLGVEPPEEALLRPYSSTLNILATTEVLEPGLRPLAGPVLFAGPCIEPRPDERDDDPALQAQPFQHDGGVAPCSQGAPCSTRSLSASSVGCISGGEFPWGRDHAAAR